MMAQNPRDPWRIAWQITTSNGLLSALLLILAIGLVIADWLPQAPKTASANPATYAQWLSATQARFGEAASTLQTLGLFTITRSPGFRALLALLAGCLLLRVVERTDRLRQSREMAEPEGEWQVLADTRRPEAVEELCRQRYRVLDDPETEEAIFQVDRWPWADLFPILIHAGGLLLLLGLLFTHLWGWQVEGLLVQSDERVVLPGTQQWVALDEDARRVSHSPSIITSIEDRVPGVQVSVSDSAGQILALQQAAEGEAVTRLMLALTEDRYFAIPEAQIIVRLAPQAEDAPEANTPMLVQVYRSPPGRLVTENEVQGDAELAVDDLTLALTRIPYARLTATFNPGLVPTAAGLAFIVVGLLGSVAWPVRRFWLRQQEEQVEVSGDLPRRLMAREET